MRRIRIFAYAVTGLLGLALIASAFWPREATTPDAPVIAGAPSLSQITASMKEVPVKGRISAHGIARLPFESDGARLGVIGGQESTFERLPGAVLIKSHFTDEAGRPGYQLCAGTVLDELGPGHVVTAAHCLYDADGYEGFTILYGGEQDGATRVAMRQTSASRAFICDSYKDGAGLDCDVGILILDDPVMLKPSEMARLATVEEYRQIEIGDLVVTGGWGTTQGGVDGGRKPSEVLKESIQSVRTEGLLKVSLTARDGEVEGACQGDSGNGPRLADRRNVVVGVFSNVNVEGGGVCMAPGYAQHFTSAPLVRLILNLSDAS